MAIKKKGVNNGSTKETNKCDSDKSKTFASKSVGKQSIVASTGNLRVTGATVSALPDTVSVPIQCTISEDNSPVPPSRGNEALDTTNAVDSDTDGFVVKRLLKEQEYQQEEKTVKSTEQPSQEFSFTSTIYYGPARPPPTAPRSSPIHEVGESSLNLHQRGDYSKK